MTVERARVVSIVGPNAAGKTTVTQVLSARGYKVLPDNYPELDSLDLDHRSILSKWRWIASWYENVIASVREGHRRLVTDRSPFDSAGHLSDGDALLMDIVKHSNAELQTLEGIATRTVYLQTPLDTTFDRIRERLTTDRWRRRYSEDSESELRRRWIWYSQRSSEWDYVIRVSGQTPSGIADEIEAAFDGMGRANDVIHAAE